MNVKQRKINTDILVGTILNSIISVSSLIEEEYRNGAYTSNNTVSCVMGLMKMKA